MFRPGNVQDAPKTPLVKGINSIFEKLLIDQSIALTVDFSIRVTNLVQKKLFDAQIMANNGNSRPDDGRPSSWIFENLISDQWIA